MDVAELLAPGPGLSTTTIVIIAVAIFGGVLAIAGKIADVMGPDWTEDLVEWAMGGGIVLFVLGGLVGAGFAYEDKPDRGAQMESVLFEGYGFTVERPSRLWDNVLDTGETGTVTKLSREGVEQDVRIHLDGTLLVITGADGLEIPTNTQLNADGSM